MAKKTTKFETFLDGLVSFWNLDDDRNPVKVTAGIRYQLRVVGSKRNFCAEQAGHNIEKLIRIPRTDLVVRGTFAVIGDEQYQVLHAQTIMDTIPQCTQLTLVQPDLLIKFDEEEAGAGGRL